MKETFTAILVVLVLIAIWVIGQAILAMLLPIIIVGGGILFIILIVKDLLKG